MASTGKELRGTRPARRPISRRRKIAFAAAAVLVSALLAFGLGEALFRVLEARENSAVIEEGPGGYFGPDPRWGWKPTRGWFRRATSEFDVTGQINALYMNDDPVDPQADADRTRILALGDSHTFAIGVSMEQTWVKVLERRLNEAGGAAFRCYNSAAIGYNLHQYLLRLIDQGEQLRPHYVIVGLSHATDFYDLLPPDRGGWIYGARLARDYFDFDESGQLTERHWEPGQAGAKETVLPASRVRTLLAHSAIFRFLRRSRLALFIGSHVRVGGQSLWPNMEIVVERETSPRHEYQWRLTEALLDKIHEESRRLGAEMIVVGIPYLAQVYDEVWDVTFGGDERYSRTAAAERIGRWCADRGIRYVDTLDAFRAAVKERGAWLHYRKDAHPTAAGHELIADVLFRAGAVAPLTEWAAAESTPRPGAHD